MSSPSRQEPILAVEELPEDVEPLLLTNLVREGLPPPLWHGSRSTVEPKAPDTDERGPLPDPEPILAPDPAAGDELHEPTAPAQTAPTLETPAVPASAGTSVVDPEDPDLHQPVDRVPRVAAEQAIASPVNVGASTSEATASAGDAQPATSMEEADLAEALERIRNLSFHYSATPADEAAGARTPAAEAEAAGPALDMDFLQEFETLLFQEVERRVLSELEERLTQHLQKVWKEQVSIAVLRALSLEGIRLRESISKELQDSLPNILQQVLHEGFDQALHPDVAEAEANPNPGREA